MYCNLTRNIVELRGNFIEVSYSNIKLFTSLVTLNKLFFNIVVLNVYCVNVNIAKPTVNECLTNV